MRLADGGVPVAAGVDPAGLSRLMDQVDAASAALRGAARALERALASAGLEGLDARPVHHVQAWADAQVAELSRRLDLARRLDTLEPWLHDEGMVWLDPALLTAFPSAVMAQATAEGLAKQLVDGRGPLPPEVVDALTRYGADPVFAAAFLQALGPARFAALPRRLAEAERDARLGHADAAELAALTDADERALRGLATVLAAAGLPDRRLTGDELRRQEDRGRELTARLLAADPWGTAQILERGVGSRFDPAFLAGLAAAADDFDRAHGDGIWRTSAPGQGVGADGRPGYVGTTGGTDPLDGMVDVMRLLGGNPTAGQRFLTEERIGYLAVERSWLNSDRGAALGAAFEAASIRARGAGGPGTPEWESAAFTTRLVHTLGPAADQLPDGLRRPLAHILGSYMPDLFVLASDAGRIEGAGVTFTQDPLSPTKGLAGAQFVRADLRPLLEEASREEVAFEYLTAAATAYGGAQLDAAAAGAADLIAKGTPTADAMEKVDEALRPYAFTMGLLTSTAGAADIADAERSDANRRQVFALVGSAGALIKNPFGQFLTGAAVSGGGEQLASALNQAERIRARYNDETAPAVEELLNHHVAQALADRKVFATATRQREADPTYWTSLYRTRVITDYNATVPEGRRLDPEGDTMPPGVPADWSFIQPGGSLKDLGNLSWAAGASGQVYDVWLDGPAGTLLSDRTDATHSWFTGGFPQKW